MRQRLSALIAAPVAHTRFLNMLSLMEHIGSRKIMTSQAKGALGQETLKHLAEETRHAFFFKRLAEKIARRPLDYTGAVTLAAPAARAYMGRLDAAITSAKKSGSMRQSCPIFTYRWSSRIARSGRIAFISSCLMKPIAGFRSNPCLRKRNSIALTSVLKEEELHLQAGNERIPRFYAVDQGGVRTALELNRTGPRRASA